MFTNRAQESKPIGKFASGRKNHDQGVRIVILLALLLALILPAAAPQADTSPRVQSLLLQLAGDDPEAMVSVIVQKNVRDASLETWVAQKGGKVTRDLAIINAFTAELPARAVSQLGRLNGVQWVSLDAPVVETGGPDDAVNTGALLSVYNQAIGANKLWSEGYQGSSVTVAVVDSGIVDSNDFKQTYGGGGDQRILTTATIVDGNDEYKDWYGHGTHVAGIIGGNGTLSQGRYIGVAPKVELVAVDVANETGEATTSDIIAGLQWINDNKDAYNIRVVNMSINSSVAESYHTSPLNAAVEILWFNGIVVVVSAGNNGSSGNGILYPPANDPFVITVGAVDDKGTASIGDDTLAAFSAYGITESGVSKPDLVAPGKNIISVLSKQDTALAVGHPNNKVYTFSGSQDLYFRMSGTSMSSAVVTGAVALLLQDEPNLTPDQVKYRLIATGQAFDAGNDAPYLDIYAAVKGATTESANNGNLVSAFLWLDMGLFLETSANWNSANWNSANWNSANWNSANWNSANWNSANWNSANWNSANWNSANWNSANWNSANWNSANWNSANWNSDDWGD